MVLKILKECATANEALDLLSKYNLELLNTQQIKIVDRTGDSIIVEGDISIKSYEEILNKIKMSEYSTWKTIHSYIFDHNKGEVHLYLFGDFSNSYTFNIKEELAKGKTVYDISSLFNNVKHKKYIETYLATKPKVIRVDTSILKKYEGTYNAVVDNTQDIIMKDNKLYLSIAGNKYEMYPYKINEFYFKEFHFNIKFLANDLGNIKSVKFFNGTFGMFEGDKIN